MRRRKQKNPPYTSWTHRSDGNSAQSKWPRTGRSKKERKELLVLQITSLCFLPPSQWREKGWGISPPSEFPAVVSVLCICILHTRPHPHQLSLGNGHTRVCLYQKCVPDFLAGFHHSATGAGTTAEVLSLLRCKEGLSACPLSTSALVLSAREAIPMNCCIFITLVWQNSCCKGGKASTEWVNLSHMYTESSLHNPASAKPRAAVHRNNCSLWAINSILLIFVSSHCMDLEFPLCYYALYPKSTYVRV